MSMTTTHTCATHTGATPSVADLLRRAGNGDQAAWEEILLRHGKRVFATVRSFRLQEADALDAVQMTWLRLAEHAHEIRDPEQLGGWLATTARRECLSILRHAQRTPSACKEALEAVADPFVGPEQRVIDADITRRLWNLVSELSPRRQTLLRALFTDHPRPYAEVARSCGIPPGGIGPTRARALAQLRDKV
jgi:RNA polymerase sigma factor (sigma-70 family)